jgi:lipopolysaccharide/colanic/teichoic acid biosynthesis glycosyltransferase
LFRGLSGGNRVAPGCVYISMKRTFDIVMSVVVIVFILSWLLPILALLIRLDSRGPVFFVQKRIGRYSRLFACYKLRTMVVNDQADLRPASDDDRRITRLGGWLRRSHLDELPQFFNVLLGSMSMVGPRPYMPADCRRFERIAPRPGYRHWVKPGITGMAQAKGLHGVACNEETLLQRYYWDEYYVDNAGLALDVRILSRTFLNLLPGFLNLLPRPSRAVRTGSPSGSSNHISVLPLERRKVPMG